MKIAKVIFDIPVERNFNYFCDDNLNPFVRVLAPLGNKSRKGFVIEVSGKIENVEYKWVKKVYDYQPIINEEILKIAKFVSRKYYSSLGQIIFSIIGGFPLRYEKNKIIFEKRAPDLSNSNFKKEIYLFGNEKEKMEFYLKIISETERSIIFLFPEVSMVEDYYNEFKNITSKRIIKYYGEMKRNERFENYLQMLNGGNLIVMGTKIAIFSPPLDTQCIIVDSPSNNSYISTQYPKYNAVDIVEEISMLKKIPLIFTSNSLSIKDYYEIENKNFFLIDKRKFENTPEVLIIDKNRAEMDKNVPFLTKFSTSIIEETVLKGKKVGIIHNRKGSLKTFKCEKCGKVLRCKNCNSYLVLSDKNMLICKYCKVKEKFKERCPDCGNKNIIERVVGIEKIYNNLKNTYPDFKIQKLTAEEREIDNKTDIFVGTIILSKILNKLDLSLIVFPHADSFLNIPEYNSEEIFFLTVNDFLWGLNKDAKIIIQTKNPNFEIFTSIKTKNFEIFYKKEINIRKLIGYPPISNIMLIEIPIKKSKTFECNMAIFRKIIENSNSEIFFSDVVNDKKNRKIFKMILKLDDKNRPDFTEIMNMKEKLNFKIEINPKII